MLVKFTTSVAGARFSFRNKQVADVSEGLAREFIRAGQAIAVAPAVMRKHKRGAATAELATAGAAETR